MDARGQVGLARAGARRGHLPGRVRTRARMASWRAGSVAPELSEASVYGALVLGVRDYVRKHGFPGVVMGLSGGVDSALTLAIAVDALGPERVQAVMMPSRYTSQMSLEDAQGRRRTRSACRYSVISDRGHVRGDARGAAGRVRRPPAGCHRGEHPVALPRLLLMGISNKTGRDAADHRQQERDGGRLRHALRRHGRRLRADQGLQQAAGVPPGELPQLAWRRDPASG